MSSTVVVINSSARQVTIKTTPGKFLSDVLQEACQKLGVDATHHGLRHNKRSLDLSNNVKISGIPSGARLELVFLSRSPAVISVALQLPPTDAQGIPNNRLIEKFPSSTTLWHIIRRFESGPFGPPRNFTARGVPNIGNGNTGAGRLYHEAPAIEIMGRELSSFIDLQKTLGQLGFNNGSVALRLKFHPTNIPLEEAMEQIGNYFKSASNENHNVEPSQSSASVQSTLGTPSPPEPEPSSLPSGHEIRNQSPSKTLIPDTEPLTSSSPSDFTGIGPGQRQISVTAPPSSSTPYAALQEYNERDYIPTTEDVLRHQARLSQSGRNQRLKTDAEITAELKAQNEKSAAVLEVEIKVRFPDQTCVNTKFSNLDTATSLFDFVQGLLEDGEEEFLLNFISAAGPKTIPKDDKVKLIGREGLDMKGRLLVNVLWAEGTSVKARQGQFLKAEVKAQAKEIQIPKIEETVVTEEKNRANLFGEPQGPGGKGKGKGLPKWLKGLPGKK